MERARSERKTLRALFEEILRDALTRGPARRAQFRLRDMSVPGPLRAGIDPRRLLDYAYGEPTS
jgi:hypothetical protein